MINFLFNIIVIFLTVYNFNLYTSDKIGIFPLKNNIRTSDTIQNPCISFNELNTQIRDGLIKKSDAIIKINELIPLIRKYFLYNGGVEYPVSEWVFPVRGYGYGAIGGVNGSGYNPRGYDYFDGNRHGGHPSHDIFIKDKNQDCIDDRTGNPVDVLSMSSGVVVALDKEWETDSDLRGGKYIWIYDTFSDALFYYAHNNMVNVNVGDIVKPGDKIAEVGRTGLNAYKKRSPTHLHITYLIINNGNVKPENIYDTIINSKIIN